MAVSTKANYIIPEILSTAVRGVFSGANAFVGSSLASSNLVTINPSFDVRDSNRIGEEISVPYFGILGEFEDRTDGTPATPKALASRDERATIGLATLGFEITRWGNNNGATPGVTPEQEAAEQVRAAAVRRMDKAVINAAVSAGAITKSVASANSPRLLDRDLIVDASVLWGDESDDSAVLICHSKAANDLDKAKDQSGRHLGRAEAAANRKIIVSDSLPLTGSSMGTVTSTGTTPPTVSLEGVPGGAYSLVIDIVTGGSSNGTATFRFSTDGGSNYSAVYAIPSGGGAIVLDDSFTSASTPISGVKSVDSLVGANGKTGITATFANGTYNADNVYTSNASLQCTSLLVRPGSLAFWYNRNALEMLPDKDPSNDSSLGWLHLYFVAHRYRRHPRGTKSGVIKLVHNVSPIA